MTTVIPIGEEDLKALFDVAVGSMNFGSGSLDNEEVETLRRVAVQLGLDPIDGTPVKFRVQYAHPYKPVPGRDLCRSCYKPKDGARHEAAE